MNADALRRRGEDLMLAVGENHTDAALTAFTDADHVNFRSELRIKSGKNGSDRRLAVRMITSNGSLVVDESINETRPGTCGKLSCERRWIPLFTTS